MALNKQKMARTFLIQKPGVAGSGNKCITCAPSAAASNPRRWLLPGTLEICWLPIKLREIAEQFPPLINKCLRPRATRRHWLSPFPTVQKACSLPSAAPLMQNHQQTSESHIQLSLSVIDSGAIKEAHQEAGAPFCSFIICEPHIWLMCSHPSVSASSRRVEH